MTPKRNNSLRRRFAIAIGIAVLLIVALLLAYEAYYRLSGNATNDRLSAHVFLACSIGTDYECDEDNLIATYPEAAQLCEQIHGNTKPMNYTAYARCLETEGMVFE